jgi:L-lactate dehydrogenase complex protein LldE
MDQLFPDTAFNTIKVLEKAGCKVIYNPAQTCCGQPAFNAGYWGEAREVCNKFISDFSDAEYVVMPSASCTGFVRNYYSKIYDNASNQKDIRFLQGKVYELSEFLIQVLKTDNVGAELHTKAAFHDSCAGLRECKLKDMPHKLLSQVKGLEMVKLNDNETCCGFGGSFAVKFDAISAAMGEQKIEHVLESGAETLISTDLSCLMHLDGVVKKQNLSIRVMHLADVLASGY